MCRDIITQLTAVINALDAIAVTGQQNRGNLYGSIETLKDIVIRLSSDFDDARDDNQSISTQ